MPPPESTQGCKMPVRRIDAALNEKGRFRIQKRPFFLLDLKFSILGRPRERNYVADIGHAGYKQNQAFKA